MSDTKRITVDVPKDVLHAAQDATGKGISETVIEGLEHLRRENVARVEKAERQKRFAEKMKALHGKLKLDVDVDELRGRPAEIRDRR